MTVYTINYSEAEEKAMSYISVSVDDWIQNAAHERARVAIEEIVKITVEKCLENNIQIPGSKDEMVLLAFNQQWIQSAEEKQTELLSQGNTE
jgi:hypothetical protein